MEGPMLFQAEFGPGTSRFSYDEGTGELRNQTYMVWLGTFPTVEAAKVYIGEISRLMVQVEYDYINRR